MRFIRAHLALTSLEISRSRIVLGAAVACAVCGLIPRFVRSRFASQDELQLITALSLTGALAALVVVPLIATTWTRGLRSGHLSFYFARPIGAGTLWLARLVAASFVAVLGISVAVAPALPLVTDRFSAWLRELQPLEVRVLAVTGATSALFVLGVLNAVALYLRRPFRSALFFLLVAGTSTSSLVLLSAHLAETSWTETAVLAPQVAAAAAACIGLLVAAWWQVSRGRIDPPDSTRAHLRAFGAVMVCGVASGPLAAYWASHPTPAALDTRHLVVGASYGSDWAVIGAPLRLRVADGAVFLVNTKNGHWYRIYTASFDCCGRLPLVPLLINEKGNRAAGLDYFSTSDGPRSIDLLSIELTDSTKLRRRPLVRRGLGRIAPLAISYDGNLLAIEDSGELSTYDLETLEKHCVGKRLPNHTRDWLTAGPTRERPTLAITAPRRVNVDQLMEFTQVDLLSCAVSTRPIDDAFAADRTLLALDPLTLTAVTFDEWGDTRQENALRNWSIESGALLGEFPLASGTSSYDVSAVYLQPGRILVTRPEGGQLLLDIIDPYAHSLDQVRLGPSDARPLARLADGAILLGRTGWRHGPERIHRFDPDSGEIETVTYGIVAAVSIAPGSLPSSLLVRESSAASLVSISSDLRPRSVPLRWWP